MKKLAIPAILLFWLVIIVIGVLVVNGGGDPPPPPPRDVPANIEVSVNSEGHQVVRVHTEMGEVVEFAGREGAMVDYQGPIYGTPYHLVYRSESEGEEYTEVVHEGTGDFLTITGPATPTDDGRWVASAGSNGTLGYSTVDIVELLEDGPALRYELNAYLQGLWVDGAAWTKTGLLTVNARRGYLTVCDAPANADLMISRNEAGEWTTWLDAARNVSVAEDGQVRIRSDVDSDVDRTLEGRLVGEIENAELGTLYLLDRTFSLIDDPEGPANPGALVLNTGDDEWEIYGWPVFAPSGLRFATATSACDPINRRPRVVAIHDREDGFWARAATFDPVELGWSSSSVDWLSDDKLSVPGWISGGLRLVDGLQWQPTHTGAFVLPEQPGDWVRGITDAIDVFSLELHSGASIDFPNTAVPSGPFRYLGFDETMGAHLLRVGTGKLGTFLVVWDETAEMWTVPGVPIPNSEGEWFATVEVDANRYQYEISVFPWPAAEEMVPAWRGLALVEELDDVSWDSDRYLSLGDGDAVQLNLMPDGAYRWSRGVG